MDELNIANQVVSTAQSMISFFDTTYSKVESSQKKKLSVQNYLRAYYFEVLHSIELLNTIDIKKFKTQSVNAQPFQKFIKRLDTQIGATILFTEDLDTHNEAVSNILPFLQYPEVIDLQQKEHFKTSEIYRRDDSKSSSAGSVNDTLYIRN